MHRGCRSAQRRCTRSIPARTASSRQPFPPFCRASPATTSAKSHCRAQPLPVSRENGRACRITATRSRAPASMPVSIIAFRPKPEKTWERRSAISRWRHNCGGPWPPRNRESQDVLANCEPRPPARAASTTRRSKLRTRQGHLTLCPEHVAVEICYPLPPARRDIEITYRRLNLRSDVVPVELRILVNDVCRRVVTKGFVQPDFFKFAEQRI